MGPTAKPSAKRAAEEADEEEAAAQSPKAKTKTAPKKQDASNGETGKPKKSKKKGKGQAGEPEPPPEPIESLLDQPVTAAFPVPSVHNHGDRPIPRDRVVNILNFTLNANMYLHCVQAERGVSSCFVSSKGSMFSDLLATTRSDTDKAFMKLKESPIYSEVAADFNREQAIKAFRTDIDFRQSRYLQILTGFNMLIEGILEAIFKLVNPLHSIKLGMVLGCYNSFLYLKDTVGRERATLGAILSDVETRGQLSPMGHLILVANMGAQKAFTKAFISTGIADDLRNDFIAFCRDSPIELIELDRNLMVSREAASAVVSNLTPELWFRKMSARMNQLDNIQKKLTLSILETAKMYCEQEKPMKKPKPKAPKKKKKAPADASAKATDGPGNPSDGPSISMDGSEMSMDEDLQNEELDFMRALASLQEGNFDMPSDWTDSFPGIEVPSTHVNPVPSFGMPP
mmetsp:Transcript_29487/g.83173  ORF Transcript_29487/g.83173 Transcript_29487/m.83173 type:complete len:457 (-) Transcript_29487:78-1448(-)|eukprot:CAMPEP_0117668782 /NCGR_PEP_ID=MMETSP0804-20121206/11750_1 /TAXON_ID=1074897 /ORGANISM="Tetraselmis astigmatica, Strain CCMP880" /LENGTH=456 /DNA_ID=CAMNT_0005476731 /DNA_START=92 /DNA_END=1462 /DNA_ORIENTATION=+